MKYKPKVNSYWLKSESVFDVPIEVFVDNFSGHPIPQNTIRIIIIQEPYTGQRITNIVKNPANNHLYDYVFTYHQDILDTNDKAVHFLCVQTWIKNYQFPPKKFGVSTLVGGKTNSNIPGYSLRHSLWDRQSEITIPKDFYLSSQCHYTGGDYSNNLILASDLEAKSEMFEPQYHVAIENTPINNMFTEKLLDCFQTKTIPIYYGCSNIGEYFNIDGIIVVNDVDDIVNACDRLTPDYYEKRTEAIEENYKKSMKFLSHTEILDNKLKEIINKDGT